MKKLAISLALASAAVAAPAHATEALFTFNVADPGANVGSGPFGTVTVTENGGALDFLMTLASGYRIHDGNANHNAFTFSILGNPTVSITNLTSGFAAVSPDSATNVSSPPFGIFFTGVDCTVCTSGYAGGYAGPLSFTVSAATSLDLTSLAFNTVGANDIYFTTDVINAAGNTGNVGATLTRGGGTPPPVPEPATWALMLVGFGAIGFAMRRKQQVRVNYSLA